MDGRHILIYLELRGSLDQEAQMPGATHCTLFIQSPYQTPLGYNMALATCPTREECPNFLAGDEAAVSFLLERGADKTLKTKDGRTPLQADYFWGSAVKYGGFLK